MNRRSPLAPYPTGHAAPESHALPDTVRAVSYGRSTAELPREMPRAAITQLCDLDHARISLGHRAQRAACLPSTFRPLGARPVLAAPLAPRTQLLAGGGNVVPHTASNVSINWPPGGRSDCRGEGVRGCSFGLMGLEQRVDATCCVPVPGVTRDASDSRDGCLGRTRGSRLDVSQFRSLLDGRSALIDLARETTTAIAGAIPDRALELPTNVARTQRAYAAVCVRAFGFTPDQRSWRGGVHRVTAWSSRTVARSSGTKFGVSNTSRPWSDDERAEWRNDGPAQQLGRSTFPGSPDHA